ncbi:MAG: AAA family ATPase [Thiomargarita sp.]|nr:AAA family ATPase [Thiomargarita sp.]
MKILQLDLVAFGLFTNKTLDFSAPGLHLLYGANEAGKSTMRRALTHFFFGMPVRTSDAYLHANDKLRIGARLLNSNGEELMCYRRKGRKNTLLDVNNKPIDEECLQAFLGGMKASQFTALCCFDHERLRQGGEDLLDGGGDVGESLFEAGTGTLKVHDVLSELDREKDELFKARGSKPLLNKTIRDYKEACKRIQETSLSVDKWSEQAKRLDEAQQRHIELTRQLQTYRAEQNRLERIKRTRPRLQRHQELKAELALLLQVILLPDDAESKHSEAKIALRTAKLQEEQAQQDITNLQNQIDAINVPQALLAHKATIDDLRGHLGSHQKAARDLPGVRTEMRTVESEARALLQRIYPQLDLKDIPSKLAVTNQQREYVKRWAAQAPALFEKQGNIEKRLSEVTEQFTQQRHVLEALPNAPDLNLLRAVLTRACKYGNLEEILAKDVQEVRLFTEKAEIGLKQIGWNQSLEALEKAALPKIERIDRFILRFQEFENDRQRIKERLLEARQRNDRSKQKINALSWAGEIPTEEALEKARNLREKHWQKIKKLKSPHSPKEKNNLSLFEVKEDNVYPFDTPTLTKKGETAVFETFEETMLDADELSDRLRREAKRVVEYSILLAEQKSAQHEQEQQTKKWHTVEALINNLQKEWEESWKTTNIKPWSPTEMRSWLNEALALRQQTAILRERRQHLQDQQQLISALCKELMQALTALKIFVKGKLLTRLSDLIGQGEACINEVTTQQRQRDNLHLEINNLYKEQQRTLIAQQQANDALKQWQTNWAQAMTPLLMPPDTPSETARNLLNDLDQVLNQMDKASGLRRRVELMQRDADIFRHDVATLVQKIAPELVEETAEQAVPALSNYLSQAEKDLTRSEQLQQHLQAEQQRLSNAIRQVKTSQAHLQILLEQAHCDNLDALEEAEKTSSHKKELQQDLADVEEQLLEQGEGMSLGELAEAAAQVDIDQLPGQLQSCTEQIQGREQERSSIDQSIGELRTLLKQMDGNAIAAIAADEAQLALAEVENLSERYMQVHLAASVLRKSMERYREQNQGPIVKRASALFQRLTLNSFCGLKTDYSGHNDQPILVGMRTLDNARIPTTGMSDGTRDQLYLALRLASIERHIEKNAPLPLILDDILINFDDDRSKVTLDILGELGQKTQILFFTHHTRLVELAQATVPKDYLVKHQL